MKDLNGQRLGGYELRERLGRGGMAEVYKAYQPALNRYVAIKVMQGQLVEDESFNFRFRREAQTLAHLQHPHIVKIFDFGVQDNVYYIVMEYIKGDNLKNHLKTYGHLTPLKALEIASQLTDALDHVHKANIIHRDLKPDNIMFIDDGHTNCVLTDFGISYTLSDSGLATSGFMMGTPAYISPEAVSGKPIDARADIYAMGIIIYEMLTGKVPYSADTPFAVLMKHANAPLPTSKDYGIYIPDEIEQIIIKSLAKDPENRYQNARDMKAAIDQAMNSPALIEYGKEQEAKPGNPDIFISYRRTDSEGTAGRIYDRLKMKFGTERIFRDVTTIQPGEDFIDRIEASAGRCDVLLAVIGTTWLNVSEPYLLFFRRRRISNPEDYVRAEIAMALKRRIRVIPVLVHEAKMPSAEDLPDDLKKLASLNAISIRNESFDDDVNRLIAAIEKG